MLVIDMKICSKCLEEKELAHFGNDKRGKYGKGSICKECDSKRGCEWAKKNPEKNRARSKRWSANNQEKHRMWTRVYIEKNPDYLRKWVSANPEKSKAANKRNNDKKISTPLGRLRNNISCAIRKSLRGNKGGKHWETLVGYTLADLREHLEKQFTKEMSWERLHEMHIDHKIPLAVFNFNTTEDYDFKSAWALENLQPLWAKDNLSKGAKLESPFQPSLLIASGG